MHRAVSTPKTYQWPETGLAKHHLQTIKIQPCIKYFYYIYYSGFLKEKEKKHFFLSKNHGGFKAKSLSFCLADGGISTVMLENHCMLA